MARVYKSGDGQWVVFNKGIKTLFAFEEDAENMATKIAFATQAQADATTLANIGEDLASIVGVYFDRGYNGGGSDPISNGDIVSLNITAAELAALITLAQELANFLGNSAVTTADYSATLNTVRTHS